MKTDNTLHEMLNTLEDVPARDAESIVQGRAQFLAEAEALRPLPPRPAVTSPSFAQKLGLIFFGPTARRVTVGFAIFTALLIVGGTSAAFAAEDSLPGDTLYGVKLTVEQAQLQNPFLDDQTKEDLLLTFTEERITELDALVEQERYDDLETAVFTLHRYVSQGREVIPASDDDPFDALIDQADEILAPVPETHELPPILAEPSPTPPLPTPELLIIEPPSGEMDTDPCLADPENCVLDGGLEDMDVCQYLAGCDLDNLDDPISDNLCPEEFPDCVDVALPEECDVDPVLCGEEVNVPLPPDIPDCDPLSGCDGLGGEFDVCGEEVNEPCLPDIPECDPLLGCDESEGGFDDMFDGLILSGIMNGE